MWFVLQGKADNLHAPNLGVSEDPSLSKGIPGRLEGTVGPWDAASLGPSSPRLWAVCAEVPQAPS